MDDVGIARDLVSVVEQEIKRRLNIILIEIEEDINESTANRIVEINETIKKNIKQQLPGNQQGRRNNKKGRKNNNNNNNNDVVVDLNLTNDQLQSFEKHNLTYTADDAGKNFLLSGNTYPYRMVFKRQLRGSYRKNRQGWVFNPKNLQKVLSWLDSNEPKEIIEPPKNEPVSLELTDEETELISKHNLTYSHDEKSFFVGGHNYSYRRIFRKLKGKFIGTDKHWRFFSKHKVKFFSTLGETEVLEIEEPPVFDEESVNLELSEEQQALIEKHHLVYEPVQEDNKSHFLISGNTKPYSSDFRSLLGQWKRNIKVWHFYSKRFENFFQWLSEVEVRPIDGEPVKSTPQEEDVEEINDE